MPTVTKRTQVTKKTPPQVNQKLAVLPRKVPQEIVTTEQVLVGVGQALTRLASQLGKVPDAELAEVLTTVKSYTGVLEAAEENLKRRALPLVQRDGTVVTEKGTRRLTTGGFVLEAQPNRTGYDPKKLESLLRMNGYEPEVAMDQKVTYVVNEGKLKDLTGNKEFYKTVDLDQVEACRYDTAFKLIVKRASEVREENGDE